MSKLLMWAMLALMLPVVYWTASSLEGYLSDRANPPIPSSPEVAVPSVPIFQPSNHLDQDDIEFADGDDGTPNYYRYFQYDYTLPERPTADVLAFYKDKVHEEDVETTDAQTTIKLVPPGTLPTEKAEVIISPGGYSIRIYKVRAGAATDPGIVNCFIANLTIGMIGLLGLKSVVDRSRR